MLADAEAVLAREGVEPVADPVVALSELAGRLLGTERALAARVNALRDVSYKSRLGTEQTKAEIQLWGQWTDRLAKTLEVLGKFNLDERRVRLSEAQGQLVAEVLQRVFARLRLNQEQQALIGTVVPEELRRLTAHVQAPEVQ